MRDELYINGRLVDLGKDTDIKLNYLVSKVCDLSNIMSNYSYTIDLPKTANNIQIIDFSDTVNVVTEFPSREHSAEIRRDGIPLFTDGKAYIDSTGETIKVILKWGGSELLSQMQKVKINEASDITDVLHWNQNLIRGNNLPYATWAGMLDGASSDTQVASRFRPVVKVFPFFDAAFARNYTMDEKYKSFLERLWMLLPTTKGNKELVDKIHFELKGSFTDTPTLITYATIGRSLNYTGGYNLCDTFSGEGNSGIYLFPKSGKYNFKIKVWGNYILAANIIIKIAQKDNSIKPELFKVLEEFTTDAKTLTPILEKEVTIEVEEGAKIEFLYFCDSFPNTFNGNADIQVRLLPNEKDYEETSYMMDYPIRENLPNMTVLDFVKSILGIFGLMAEIKDNIFHFFTMDDVILNKENALDITDFLVNKESEELRYTYGLTQNNILKYEEDELIPKGYGNYYFSVNTYAKEENIVAQSKFAAGIPALYKLEDGKYRLQKSNKPRLFFENGKRTLRIGYYDEIFNNFWGEEVECTNFTFNELKYESLVSAFWNGYMSAFTGNARIRKVEVVLPPAFMQTFSFQIPVIIDSNYYSVLSVKNYGRNGVAEMELVLLDGIAPAKQTPLRNVILESFNTPIKFDYSSVALYSDMDRDTAINGKLIRELDETTEIPDKAYMPVDEGYGSAKRVDVNNIFLHKDRADTAAKHITFQQGITVETTTDTLDLVVRRLAEILQLNVTEVATLAKAIVKEFVSSETFIPGFAGEGFKIWQIAAGEWHGEIDSLTIRRSLNAFELLIQKYRAINGGLVISQGSGKIKSVTEDATHYLLEMEGDLTLMPDDFIRCQTFGAGTVEEYKFDFNSDIWLYDRTLDMTLDNTSRALHFTRAGEEMLFLVTYGCEMGETINITLKITGVSAESRLYTADDDHPEGITIDKDGIYTFIYTHTEQMGVWGIAYLGTTGNKDILIEQVPEEKIETATTKYYWVKVDSIESGMVKVLKSEFDTANIPTVGDEVVQMGNETDVTRQALIFLSSTEGKPFIDVLAGVNSKSFEGKMQMRAGYIGDIQDPDFGADQPEGYGLYCANAYLKGKIILKNGQSVEDYMLSQIETSFKVLPGLVSIEVGKMQIGANNFLPDSSFEEGNPFTTGSWVESFQEYKPVYGSKMIAWENVKQGDWYTTNIPYIKIKPNTDYVFSIYLCYDGDFTRTSSAIFLATGTTFDTVTRAEYIPLPSEKKTWERVILPFKSAENENYFSFRLGAVSETGLKMLLADAMQLEEGTVATAWRESTGDILSQSKSLIKAESDKILLQVTKTTTGTRNYILYSRMDTLRSIHNLAGGTAQMVTDEKMGQVVEYFRPALGGEFQFNWELSATRELNNTDIIFSVIAKNTSGEGTFQYGGWNTTFGILNSDTCNKTDLGEGWYQYWVTLNNPLIRGAWNTGAFGINSIWGTWRFYAVGVYKGNRPIDWTPAPEDLEYRVTEAELKLQPDNIWLGIKNTVNNELAQTGINIVTGKITLRGANTEMLLPNGQSAALFTTDSTGNPIIQGRFLKLSDGAEIAGFTVTPDSLHSYDGKSSISIGTLSAGYRGITLSAKDATLLNVFAGTAIGTGIMSNAPTALVTYGSVEMHQGGGQNWNVAGALFGGTIYGTSYQTWGNGAGMAQISVTESYSRYYVYHQLNHTDYHVIATPYYDSSGGNYAMHLNSYIRVENKTPTGFYLQVVNADNGRGVNSGIMFTIIGRNN